MKHTGHPNKAKSDMKVEGEEEEEEKGDQQMEETRDKMGGKKAIKIWYVYNETQYYI